VTAAEGQLFPAGGDPTGDHGDRGRRGGGHGSTPMIELVQEPS
jgi:hypothetical protein